MPGCPAAKNASSAWQSPACTHPRQCDIRTAGVVQIIPAFCLLLELSSGRTAHLCVRAFAKPEHSGGRIQVATWPFTPWRYPTWRNAKWRNARGARAMKRRAGENPFIFGEIITESGFVDRTEELGQLVRDCQRRTESLPAFHRVVLERAPLCRLRFAGWSRTASGRSSYP